MKYAPFGNQGFDMMDEDRAGSAVAVPEGINFPGPDVMSEICPSRRVLALIADKWTMLILPALQ
ncbi:MAG: hypothetical protein ACLPX9_17560, partial [Rhodomicrobium sp.]